MESLPQQNQEHSEHAEKEQFYVVVNKNTKTPEGIRSATLIQSVETPVEVDALANPTHLTKPDNNKPLFTSTERAREQLGLGAEDYILFGPYESEQMAQQELDQNHIETNPEAFNQAIQEDNRRAQERAKKEEDRQTAP